MSEKLTKIAEKLEEKMLMALENIESADTHEVYEVADIIKDMYEAQYYCSIVEAMEKDGEEYGETYDYKGKMYGGNRYNRSRRMMFTEPEYMDMQNTRMYSNNGTNNNNMGMRSNNSRVHYFDTKTRTSDVKQKNEAMEKYLTDIAMEVSEALQNASPEEKTFAKTKMINLAGTL